MICVCTRYRRSDQTHAAIAVMRYLDMSGKDSKTMHYEWRTAQVDPAYDNRIKPVYGKSALFSIEHIIWTSPVADYFMLVPEESRAVCSLFTGWDLLDPYEAQVLGAYKHVLFPTVKQAMTIRDRFQLDNVAVLPFHCGYPITEKRQTIPPEPVKLFMSLYGNQLRRIDEGIFNVLESVLRDKKHTQLVIACSPSAPLRVTDKLKKLQEEYPKRFSPYYDAPWHLHAMLMSDADLTIWPVKYDGMGLVGLTSLHMGTPVITWNVAPMNEHVAGNKNGITVNCDIANKWAGVQHAIPNYQEFEESLRWIVDNPKVIVEFNGHTHDKLNEWDTEFTKGLDTILPK